MSPLPFSSVVGLEDAKFALTLAAVEPLLAGVLLRGDKGSAKTTLARGLAALLPGEAPFVELPLGASEERVIGALDLGELLTSGQAAFRPGLLASAHGGVLYIDEINLLADHLVDALLDVAVSGVNRVERDGLSHSHPARFVLVASMNPEEGELRPQLLDRFGLAVSVAAPADPAVRALAVRRQLSAERSPAAAGVAQVGLEGPLRDRIAGARSVAPGVAVADPVIEVASRLALAVGAEGLRADLMLCRAASAAAALDGRREATEADVRAVAELVLGHRRRRKPFDEPGISPDELDAAWQEAASPRGGETGPDGAAASGQGGTDASGQSTGEEDASGPPEGHGPRGSGGQRLDAPGPSRTAVLPDASRRPTATARHNGAAGGFAPTAAAAGRFVRAQPVDGSLANLDPRSTAVALAARRVSQPGAPPQRGDLRGAERERRAASLVVFVVDASASMGVERRMAATKSAVLGLLGDAYRRRGRVALIACRGEVAEVVLRPTGSVEVAKARLAEVPTGGATPLAAGLDAARQLVESAVGKGDGCHVVVITDGRATAGPGDPVEASRDAARHLAASGAVVLYVDSETGPTRLGLTARLAEVSGAGYLHVGELDGDGLERNLRAAWEA